jgi:hypothetical protein
LLVEAFTENQSSALLKATLLESYPIQVDGHVSLNSSWGVISTDALDGLSDEAIQSFLADQTLTKANRLIGKHDDKPFPLLTVFLTYEVPDMPSHVYLGYEQVTTCRYPELDVVLQVSEIRAHTTALFLRHRMRYVRRSSTSRLPVHKSLQIY